MAHKKSAGTTKNGRDSNPKYLGVKLSDGSQANIGSILVRQRGSNILAGNGVSQGSDYTLFALKDGKVKMTTKRKVHFDGSTIIKKVASMTTKELNTEGAFKFLVAIDNKIDKNIKYKLI